MANKKIKVVEVRLVVHVMVNKDEVGDTRKMTSKRLEKAKGVTPWIMGYLDENVADMNGHWTGSPPSEFALEHESTKVIRDANKEEIEWLSGD